MPTKAELEQQVQGLKDAIEKMATALYDNYDIDLSGYIPEQHKHLLNRKYRITLVFEAEFSRKPDDEEVQNYIDDAFYNLDDPCTMRPFPAYESWYRAGMQDIRIEEVK